MINCRNQTLLKTVKTTVCLKRWRYFLFIYFFLQLSPGPGVQVQAEHVQLCRFLQNINSFIKKTVGHLNISPTCCLLNISLQIYSHRSAAETEIILYLRLCTRLWSLLGCDPVHGVEVRARCRPVVHTRPSSYFALCMQAKSHHHRKGMF